MFWLLLIPLIILWAVFQRNILETTGRSPQSRASLRRQRREARKLGIDPRDLHVNYRSHPSDYASTKAKVDRIGRYIAPFVILVWVWIIGVLLNWWH